MLLATAYSRLFLLLPTLCFDSFSGSDTISRLKGRTIFILDRDGFQYLAIFDKNFPVHELKK